MAESQYAGRGQLSNIWASEPGKNLTFSILLKPAFLSPEKQFNLNKAISLAINDVLCTYFPHQASIKWPNDNYVNNEKIAGLLIENMVQGNKIKSSIIGIGMNVNQVFFSESITNVTSFAKILHKDYDLKILLSEICAAVEVRYLQLRSGHSDKLDTEYLSRLYKYNIVSRFVIDGECQNGKISGISPQGYLQVDLGDEIRQFGLKEIQFV